MNFSGSSTVSVEPAMLEPEQIDTNKQVLPQNHSQMPPQISSCTQGSRDSLKQGPGDGVKGVVQFCCVYTKMKTQKRKVWKDGRLVLNGTSISLYDAHPHLGSGDPPLDHTEILRIQAQNVFQRLETHLETEMYMIQLEGLWQVTPRQSTSHNPVPLVSKGMQKVMARKFQKPGSYMPLNPLKHTSTSEQNNLTKRQRAPLQPGELQIRLHGAQQTIQSDLRLVEHQNHPQSGYYPPPHPPGRMTPIPRAHHDERTNRNSADDGDHDLTDWRSRGHQTRDNSKKLGEVNPSQRQLQNQRNTSDLPQEPSKAKINGPCGKLRSEVTCQDHWNSTNRQLPPASFPLETRNQYAMTLSAHHQPDTLHNVNTDKENSTAKRFVSNDFHASQYYGEEAESAGEESEPDQFHWDQPPLQSTERAVGPNPFVTMGSEKETPHHQKNRVENCTESLSRSQLLELLGGGEPTSYSHVNVVHAAAVADSLTMDPQDPSSRNGQATKGFEFILPSASDTSSDEAEHDT